MVSKPTDLVGPKPIAGLSKKAKAEWRQLAPLAWNLGTLKAQNFRAFGLLCESLALETDARHAILRDGITVGDAQKAHPALKVLDSARRAAVRLLNDFGLSPGDRKPFHEGPDGGADVLEALSEASVDWCFAKPKRKRAQSKK